MQPRQRAQSARDEIEELGAVTRSGSGKAVCRNTRLLLLDIAIEDCGAPDGRTTHIRLGGLWNYDVGSLFSTPASVIVAPAALSDLDVILGTIQVERSPFSDNWLGSGTSSYRHDRKDCDGDPT
jgi:hypothetical protein